MRRLVVVFIVAVGLVACGSSAQVENVVTFETPDGSTFKVQIDDPDILERLRDALEKGDGRAGIPNGQLVPGDGGVNTGHQWHMTDVELVDFTMELCDGTASMVDDDLDYWLNTVGRFCPWEARVVDIGPP